MRRRTAGTLVGGLILALVPFLPPPAPAAPAAATSASAPTAAAAQHPFHHACSTPRAGRASCNALIRNDVATSAAAVRRAAAAPSGLSPANLKSAYKLPSTGGSGQTVAIVDAYDAPTAEADLG